MFIHALQTVIHLYKKLYIRQIFLIQMNYRLQSMYNHMVGRAASVVFPFYSIPLGGMWIVKESVVYSSLSVLLSSCLHYFVEKLQIEIISKTH